MCYAAAGWSLQPWGTISIFRNQISYPQWKEGIENGAGDLRHNCPIEARQTPRMYSIIPTFWWISTIKLQRMRILVASVSKSPLVIYFFNKNLWSERNSCTTRGFKELLNSWPCSNAQCSFPDFYLIFRSSYPHEKPKFFHTSSGFSRGKKWKTIKSSGVPALNIHFIHLSTEFSAHIRILNSRPVCDVYTVWSISRLFYYFNNWIFM